MYIETYGDQIINLLINKIEAANLCEHLHMCSSASTDFEVATVEVTSSNGVECMICQWVIGEVEKYISGNATESEVIAILESVCSVVPSAERQIVRSFSMPTL